MYNTVFFIANKPLSKEFEVAELKLLVDAIQSSKFITEKKSNELIKKLFKDRYELCKKLFEQASLSDFCEGIKDGIMPVELIIDETYETYIVCDYNPDDLSECCPMTLDSFLRKTYHEIRNNKEKIHYIAGCCGYHC